MNKIICLSCIFILNLFSLQATIIETQKIADILPFIDSVRQLVLVDMDDTLTDSTISLGSGAWRKYIRQKIKDYEACYGNRWDGANLHDYLTFYVARHVPVKPVEEAVASVVAEVQSRGIPIFVLTARGKSNWYSTKIKDIDQLTNYQLMSIGLDFSLSRIPSYVEIIDPLFYEAGVIYSEPLKKGEFLKIHLDTADFAPTKIIFIDDKMDQVRSMEEAAKELGIPFAGFWYTRAERQSEQFDPILATIQLIELLKNGIILNDEQAAAFKEKLEIEDPDLFFNSFLDEVNLSILQT